jgi:hypothetical protein
MNRRRRICARPCRACFPGDGFRRPRYRRRVTGIQTSLYLVAVALCVFCTGLTARLRGRPLTYFTAFLVIQSATFLCELLMAHPAAPLKSL